MKLAYASLLIVFSTMTTIALVTNSSSPSQAQNTNTESKELTEAEKIAKRERFYDQNPDFPRPDDLSSQTYDTKAKDDGRLENPDEVQPQLGGPQGDPFCKVVRSLSNSPIGSALDSTGEGLDQFEKRCGDLDGENTEEDNLTMLESVRDSADTPTDMKNELSIGLDVIDCAKKDSFGSLSSSEKENCDTLMLDAQAQCDNDSTISYCLHSGYNNFNPIETYIENNNLDSNDNDNEDNDSESEEEEEDN